MFVLGAQAEPHWYAEVGVGLVQVRSAPSMLGRHGVQLEPQLSTPSSATQVFPHLWNPVAQMTSHTPDVQMAVLPGGLGHTEQLGPHDVGEFAVHAPPQRL